jgi:hypothetical protein
MPDRDRNIWEADFVLEWKSAKVMAGEDVTRSMADWVNPVGRRRTYEMAKDSAVRG